MVQTISKSRYETRRRGHTFGGRPQKLSSDSAIRSCNARARSRRQSRLSVAQSKNLKHCSNCTARTALHEQRWPTNAASQRSLPDLAESQFASCFIAPVPPVASSDIRTNSTNASPDHRPGARESAFIFKSNSLRLRKATDGDASRGEWTRTSFSAGKSALRRSMAIWRSQRSACSTNQQLAGESQSHAVHPA